MKIIKYFIISVIGSILVIGCQPDKTALDLAKAEGIKIGYDSAKRALHSLSEGKLLYEIDKEKYFHPGFPGHVHDGTAKLSEMITRGDFTKGVLAITDGSLPGHKIVGYLPFINPNAVAMFDGDRMPRPKHGHFTYKNVISYVIDKNGNIIDSVSIAVIGKRY